MLIPCSAVITCNSSTKKWLEYCYQKKCSELCGTHSENSVHWKKIWWCHPSAPVSWKSLSVPVLLQWMLSALYSVFRTKFAIVWSHRLGDGWMDGWCRNISCHDEVYHIFYFILRLERQEIEKRGTCKGQGWKRKANMEKHYFQLRSRHVTLHVNSIFMFSWMLVIFNVVHISIIAKVANLGTHLQSMYI